MNAEKRKSEFEERELRKRERKEEKREEKRKKREREEGEERESARPRGEERGEQPGASSGSGENDMEVGELVETWINEVVRAFEDSREELENIEREFVGGLTWDDVRGGNLP